MKAVHYRKLIAADYADALLLYEELIGEVGVASQTQFIEVLNHKGTSIWGADQSGKIVSIATLHLLPNMTYDGRPYALIENVVTLKTKQKQGFGRGVMTAIINAAWDADAYKIMLLSGKNTGAKGFYEALGFSDDGKHAMMLRRVPLRKP